MFTADRSIIFREILSDASLENQLGFQEADILPLFIKYQNKRQLLINIFSFMTYVLQLPTKIHLIGLYRRQFSNILSRNVINKFKISHDYKS